MIRTADQVFFLSYFPCHQREDPGAVDKEQAKHRMEVSVLQSVDKDIDRMISLPLK